MASGARFNAAGASTVRGAVQGGAGWAITEFVDAFHIYSMDERQFVISVIVFGAIFTFIQNTIENSIGKALLKKVPESKTVPLVDNTGKP